MFQNLNPLDRSTSILEILIMLIVAFILGFLIAWWLRRSKTAVVDNSAELDGLKTKNLSLKTQVDGFNSERQKLQDSNHRIQADLDACLKSKAELASAPAAAPMVVSAPVMTAVSNNISDSDRDNAEKLGFHAASESEKDDLTKISGVGPFIEKKLNGLGIYTFDQISKFTPDTIDRVTAAIEFFPGRIQRDNWVGQAGDLKNA